MDEDKRIYIGNLEYSVLEEELSKAFREKGLLVKELKIIKDKFTGRSKGFGFAEFEGSHEAREAIDIMDGSDLKGRKLRVSKAKRKTLDDQRVSGY